MRYFNYETVAREAAIPADKLELLAMLYMADDPHDPMMAELHILRACMAIKSRRLTIDAALDEAKKMAA